MVKVVQTRAEEIRGKWGRECEKMQLGMRREVIKNAENAIENAPGTAPESQKAYKKLIS